MTRCCWLFLLLALGCADREIPAVVNPGGGEEPVGLEAAIRAAAGAVDSLSGEELLALVQALSEGSSMQERRFVVK